MSRVPLPWLIFPLLLFLAGIQIPSSAQETNSGTVDEVIVVDQAVVTLIDNVDVAAEESGVIEAILAQEGDMIQKGQMVARLTQQVQEVAVERASRELEAARLSAENSTDIEYAQKSAEVAHKTLERSQQANERTAGTVSQTEIERLRLEYERGVLAERRARMEQAIARAKVQIREAELQAAKIQLQRHRMQAPLDGQVVQRLAQPGEWVSAGQPVLRIIRLDRLRVQVFMDARIYDKSLMNRPVQLEVPMPPDGEVQSFDGRVTFVSPEVIPNREQISVWAEIDNHELSLRPGSTGTLRILAPEGR